MPDFSLIERHPWATVGIVAGGGFLLFLVFHRKSSGAAPSYAAAPAASDPNALALQAQTAQIQGSIQGLQIQGGTQVQLATIGADVSKYNTAASLTAQQTQTAAELQFGTSGQALALETARLNATVQLATLDAIVGAYGGNRTVLPTGGGTTQTPAAPITQTQAPPVPQFNSITYPYPGPIPVETPVYVPPAGTTGNGGVPAYDPNSIVPGGQQLLPSPTYASCDPHDSACVERNRVTEVNFMDNSLVANASNNFEACRQSAELSKGQPNYDALVAACSAAYTANTSFAR